MPGQQTIKFALYEIHTDPVWNEIVSGETVPFLPHAELKIEFFHRREIDAWGVLFPGTRRVDRENTSDIKKSWDFGGLKIERNGQRRMIIVPERKNAHEGDERRADDEREREVAKD